ncbi:hypothetical protein ABOM_012226 [Aspergillus bombycis]|uniref:Uncharacterized protein n=1 Tax=Aspergillus bombycis TaxID=109264 RepID=A0A1F7ZI88_9EURO|nr:hypothetical protein ABOM_012226 [Aspergillus bombycis]OGM39172.1 hypothetical protein ABOM_012226 [Aspergillus bombycis]
MSTVRIGEEDKRLSSVTLALKVCPQEVVAVALARVASTTTTVSASRFSNILIIQPQSAIDQDDIRPYSPRICCLCQTDRVHVHASFDRETVSPQTIQMLLFQFRHILTLPRRSPDVTVSRLQSIRPEEAEQLNCWNADVDIRREQLLANRHTDERCCQTRSSPAICA